jgi:hypothetical protein
MEQFDSSFGIAAYVARVVVFFIFYFYFLFFIVGGGAQPRLTNLFQIYKY